MLNIKTMTLVLALAAAAVCGGVATSVFIKLTAPAPELAAPTPEWKCPPPDSKNLMRRGTNKGTGAEEGF